MAGLKPTLGFLSGTAMMLNIVLGTGLFILPGLVAQQTGAASLIYWLVSILLAAPLLMAFWVLAAHKPSAGGVADLVGEAFGKRFFVIASYLFLGAVMLGLTAIALTGGFALHAGFGLQADGMAVIILAIAIGSNFLNTDRAGQLGSLACVVSLSLIVGLIVLGFSTTSSSGLLNFSDLTDFSEAGHFIMGLSVIPLIFFAFTGWEVAISLGGEFKNAKRNLPMAIAASFLIASMLYLLCALLVIHAGGVAFNEAPFVHVLVPVFGAISSQLVALVISLLIVANLFAAIWSVSRMIYSISLQGFLPSVFSRLSRQIPTRALIGFGIVGLVMLGLHKMNIISIDIMLTLASINFLCLYGLVSAVGFLKLTWWFHKSLSGLALVTVLVIMVMTQSQLYLGYACSIIILA